MGDHFMADHIEHDEDFNWNEDVKPLWKPQEISAGEYIVNKYWTRGPLKDLKDSKLILNKSELFT